MVNLGVGWRKKKWEWEVIWFEVRLKWIEKDINDRIGKVFWVWLKEIKEEFLSRKIREVRGLEFEIRFFVGFLGLIRDREGVLG